MCSIKTWFGPLTVIENAHSSLFFNVVTININELFIGRCTANSNCLL